MLQVTAIDGSYKPEDVYLEVESLLGYDKNKDRATPGPNQVGGNGGPAEPTR